MVSGQENPSGAPGMKDMRKKPQEYQRGIQIMFIGAVFAFISYLERFRGAALLFALIGLILLAYGFRKQKKHEVKK